MSRIFFVLVLIFALPRVSHASGRHFDRVITVIFENTNYADALHQPFFAQLANQGASFSNFVALVHPSQGNYVALTSGSIYGVQSDRTIDLNVKNVIDLLEAKGVSWKVYAENYPGGCFTGSASGYVRKHDPFVSYLDVQQDPARCGKIVEASQFDRDLAANQLPDYVFYIPNIKNDGHDTGVAYADRWYAQRFSGIVANAGLMNRTILLSTFDESGASARNQIYTSIVGGPVRAGVYPDALTTVSLLKMVEDNWDLGDLGRDDASAIFPNIWR